MEVPGVARNYTTHMYSIQAQCYLGDVAETRWTHRRADYAEWRLRHGDGKMPFERLIHANLCDNPATVWVNDAFLGDGRSHDGVGIVWGGPFARPIELPQKPLVGS